MESYVLYAVVEKAGVRSGSTVQVKVGALSSARLGFVTEELARQFITRSNVPRGTVVVRSSELGHGQFPVNSNETDMLCFPDQVAIELFFADREAFPYQRYIVPIAGIHAG